MSASPRSQLKGRKDVVRSRSGCGTCKDRKKKCDELWDEQTRCERCRVGKLECYAIPIKPVKPRNSKSKQMLISTLTATDPSVDDTSALASTSAFTLPDFIFPPALAYNPHDPLLGLQQLTTQSIQSDQSFTPARLDLATPLPTLATALALSPSPASALPDEETQSWERLLSQLDEPQSALNEIRQFSEQWWSFYSSLNESYFYSVPKPVRDLVREQMRVLCAADDLGRAALSSWAASHYATVLAKEGDGRHKEYEQKASKFYHKALELLQDRTYPLPVRIGAILDMRLSQLDHQGAISANFLMSCGEYFIQEECGLRPRLNLAKMTGSDTMAFRSYAYVDVLRTVCTRGRRTVFDLTDDPNEDHPGPSPLNNFAYQALDGLADQDPVAGDALRVHLGLPLGLLLNFAAISNLIYDATTLPLDEVTRRTDLIHQQVLDWVPPPSTSPIPDSVQHVSDLATQEIWRQACLIYLHTALRKFGPLALPVRRALSQLLRLARALAEPDPGAHPSVFTARARAPAWFLAATVAVTAEEREACRERLGECGEGRLWRDNLGVVEGLWGKVDGDGGVRDWREECEREGWVVAFM